MTSCIIVAGSVHKLRDWVDSTGNIIDTSKAIESVKQRLAMEHHAVQPKWLYETAFPYRGIIEGWGRGFFLFLLMYVSGLTIQCMGLSMSVNKLTKQRINRIYNLLMTVAYNVYFYTM